MTATLRDLRSAGFAAAFAAILIAGPVSAAPAPTEQFAVARAAVADAVSAGGAEFAPVALRGAQDKLDRANAAMAAGANRDARRWSEEAEADARLAAATARATKAERAVAEVQSGIRALQEELARNSIPR